MSFTSQEKEFVVQSFLKLSLDIDHTAAIFYRHLFEILPEARNLFARTNMQEQGRVLMRMLDTLVEILPNPDGIREHMATLGKRHLGYGVQRAHYQPFGEALVWTVEAVLGEDYTPEIGEAWGKAFQLLADTATSTYD